MPAVRARESLWAVDQGDGTVRFDNISWFVPDIACGDVVTTEPDDEEAEQFDVRSTSRGHDPEAARLERCGSCHHLGMAGRQLPAGWTLEEIRKVSGDREATPLDTDRVVTGWPAQGERIQPEIILGFHGLCLVKAVNDDDWYMGSLNDDDSVTCWSAYGDLYDALRGL